MKKQNFHFHSSLLLFSKNRKIRMSTNAFLQVSNFPFLLRVRSFSAPIQHTEFIAIKRGKEVAV